ncbi:MAG: ABC transporter permease subunit [Gammaproteobacteria bacterium]|nr:ABC transporter permease subunit [Gammaproteobacteria bacterium]
MKGGLAIAGRELRAWLYSPLAWIVLAGACFVTAWVFLSFVQHYLLIAPKLSPGANAGGVTGLVVAPSLLWATLVVAILTPLMSMGLVAGEKRSGTLRMLRAAPISSTALVLGKYIALVAFLWLVAALAVAMPLSLELGTTLDLGRLGAGALGLALAAAAFGAICLFMSSLTRQPALAALGGFGVLVLLLVINLAAQAGGGVHILGWLAFQPHLANFLRGIVNTADLAYFLIMITLFLCLAIWKLDTERLAG